MNIVSHLARLPYFLGLWQRFPIGSVQERVHYGVYPYAHYAFGVYWAAVTARRLGIDRISVCELGVAGGRGLLALELVSREIAIAVGVQIDVFGFDTGCGMPEAGDFRDLPHVWSQGFFQMDEQKLRSRLHTAQLIVGNVRDTVPPWRDGRLGSPLGFAAFDLDYYSSTKDALEIFCGESGCHLPRVYCYFDDIASSTLSCMNEFVGELLAIKEFNAVRESRKLAKMEQLRVARPRWEIWQDRMYAYHDFEHPLYRKSVVVSDANREFSL